MSPRPTNSPSIVLQTSSPENNTVGEFMFDKSPVYSLIDEFFAQQYVITEYQLQPYNIKLTNPWKSASSTLHYRQGLLIRLTIKNPLLIDGSLSAIGECAPMAEIGTESLAQAQNFFYYQLQTIKGKPFNSKLLSDTKLLPACRFALESILLIFLSKIHKKNIARCLNPSSASAIKINTMLGSLDDGIISRTKNAEQAGFNCIKLKMGLTDIETETDILRNLLEQLSPATLIRLDANKSWSFKETQWILNQLKAYHRQIDSIEEPLSDFNCKNDKDWKKYQDLQNKSPITLALDESFSMNLPLSQFPVHRVILKPMVQGGILNTLKIAKLALSHNIQTIITSTIETGYGLQIISHACAALNNQHHHGLDTSSWLEDSLIAPPEIKLGYMIIN
ncbi:MAG: hypothetical protein KZQ83_18170 [gamma proteobacterium symbiont of Taylorina sp.]|nr:hypothetical protein [gamma proteobacterium symbiont of Taylorina sp.]